MPDPNEALDLVRRDVELGLSGFLTADPRDPDQGFDLQDEFRRDVDGGIRNEATGTVAVAWRFRGLHELPRSETGLTFDVMGFQPTGRVVEVRGVTLVHDEHGEVRFSRFVDWTTAMADIGVGFYKRPVLDDPESAGVRLT